MPLLWEVSFKIVLFLTNYTISVHERKYLSLPIYFQSAVDCQGNKVWILKDTWLLLPWWCGPLRRTLCICRQSRPHLQQPGVPQGRDVGWCRWGRPCPRRQSIGPWSRLPSGRSRSAGEEPPHCGGSACWVPRLLSLPTPWEGGDKNGD